MTGPAFEQSKRALQACISSLDAEDLFGVVAFNHQTDCFHHSIAPASDVSRKRALAWIERILCEGGTEMLPAMTAAMEVLGSDGGDIFLITDGEVYSTGPLIEHMAGTSHRVHVLGVGTASQHRFMAALARRSGGLCEMVAPTMDVGMAGLKLFNQVTEPYLKDPMVKVDEEPLQVSGAFWEGHPLMVSAPPGSPTLPSVIVIEGEDFFNMKVVTLPDGLVSLLWVSRELEDLDTKLDMALKGTPLRLEAERKMEDLSTRYGLASRVMSLVAVVDRVGDEEGAALQQSIVPLGLPEGSQRSQPGIGLRSRGMSGMYAPVLASVHYSYGAPGTTGTPPMSMASSSILLRDSAVSGGITTTATSKSIDLYQAGTLDTDTLAELLGVPVPAPRPEWPHLERPDDNELVSLVGAGGGPVFKSYEYWGYTGSLLDDLGVLWEDGGLPPSGYDKHNRLADTMLMVLLISLSGDSEVFQKHQDRMMGFITQELDKEGAKGAFLLRKFRDCLARGCKISKKDLEGFLNDPNPGYLIFNTLKPLL